MDLAGEKQVVVLEALECAIHIYCSYYPLYFQWVSCNANALCCLAFEFLFFVLLQNAQSNPDADEHTLVKDKVRFIRNDNLSLGFCW